MDILVSAKQLETILTDGRLDLVVDTSGDFNARMLSGKHLYNHVAKDPVAVICLGSCVTLTEMPVSAVFVGSLITEIHSTIPCDFVPCFMYDTLEKAQAKNGHKTVRAVLRAILRPRLLSKSPREIYVQDEVVDPYMVDAYQSLVGDGAIIDHAFKQTCSGVIAGLQELLAKRFDNDIDFLKKSMRCKWQ